MIKKRYILLFFLLLWPISSVLASSDITINVGQFSEIIPADTIDTWLTHSSNLAFDSSYKSEYENVSFCPSSLISCSLLISPIQRSHIKNISQTNINKDRISSYVEDLARRVNHDPVDAKFQVDSGKVSSFLAAQDGLTLKKNESTDLIYNYLEKDSLQNPQTIVLTFDTNHPETNYKDINDLGISSLVGEGTSNFKGSPKNRVHNIQVAIQQFNGTLIKPGEEFSFVKTLGDVDGEHGYLPELVIKGDKTEPDFGGGICQVSTTMFRAALYSGLKITARRNHAYPVSYYNPQGMDATVYVPQPDLKFINNTPNYILVQVRIDGTQLFFDFYGTDDGRKSTIEGPTVIDKQPDGSMKTTFTQHVVNKEGTEFIKDVFNSNYDSPYRHPHPGGPVLSAKPDNWSDDEWKAYKKMVKEMEKAA